MKNLKYQFGLKAMCLEDLVPLQTIYFDKYNYPISIIFNGTNFECIIYFIKRFLIKQHSKLLSKFLVIQR